MRRKKSWIKSKKIAYGVALALTCGLFSTAYAEQTQNSIYNEAITGNVEKDLTYVTNGILDVNTGEYNFTKDLTSITVEDHMIVGGPWVGKVSSAVSSVGEGNKTVLNINNKDLNIIDVSTSHCTGITAINKGIVEINDPGTISITTNGGGQTAALFANGGGEIYIHNADGSPVVIRSEAKNSGSGVGIKTMNGIAGRSHIQVDGLIDLVGSIVNGQGMGEGLSAVASTIDVGGGRIIMDDDGTGSTNFGGGNSFAIRAYGEFATENYGIVNVNVEKESDTADAKAIGAGSNVTQIVGDFSTVGGMGTKGTINVGLSTADSYWYGDYSAGSGWGVTPGDYGCLNLWMSNGAKWEGYTRYATNLVMDSGATWYGYSYDNDALNLNLKNAASWTPSNAGVGSVTTGSVLNFAGAKGDEKVGSIMMSDENGVNVVVKNYSGDTTLLYKHDSEEPTNIIGGTFTIGNAEEDSKVILITDNSGIDIKDISVVNDVLDGLAQKLFYNGYTTGENNLTGYVGIGEGLTSSTVLQKFGGMKFDSTTGQGSLDWVQPTSQQTSIYSQAITGKAAEDLLYVTSGVLDINTGEYNFTKDLTSISVEDHMVAGGPWLGKISSAISSVGQGNKTVLNMNNKDLYVLEIGKSGSTGITAIGKGVVEINDPKVVNIRVKGGGQTAALFANGGGEIYIHNADGSPVVIRSESNSSGSGVGIKTMNGAAGRSHIQVDGLIDLVGSVVNNKGMGEGLSAVASTIDVGGGRIIMDDDGTGSTNFGGGNSFAIRAYGEFVTQNYGIVNVNVEKESDAADAKAIGAGSNVTQIVGDFSTVGGMGTKGTINVGLSTADSYWYGDYSAGSGWGVTPGDYGCLNLWMSNGAKWEGYTRYATNLVMDSGATWYGYSYDNDALNLTLKNDASWTPSNAGVGSVTTGSVLNFVGAKGDEKVGTINMSDENGVNVVVKNYSGNTTLLYKHDAATPANIIGGTFTIANAEEDSRITLVTDNTGIDTENIFVVNDVLNGLAQKLFYTGYIDGEENLNGYVVIAEGLTSASAAKRTADIVFDETTGQGGIADDSIRPEIVYPSEQEKVFMSSAITGDAREDIAYVKAGILDLETGEYNFTKKATTITVENHMIAGGPWLGNVSSAVSSVGEGNKTVLNMNNNDLNIIEVGSSGSTGIAAINKGVVEINDPGTISITTNGGGQTAALFANGGGEIYIHNAGGDAVVIRSESKSSGSGVGIKTMNGTAGRSYIKIDGLIDLVGSVVDGKGMGEGLSAVASTIDVGGGRIIMDDDGTGGTNFGGGNSFAIRAYGEFVTQNYGIVNVNVVKESDAADAKAIGAGNNVTQIAGNFSTVGGMGTKGTINVGLSTADSFWYGNYSAGSGWGVTPGDYGCLNLWMSNGAKWEGYTGYATNLVMDTDATWKGYAAEKAGLQLELKNDAIYTASSLGKEGIDTSYIHTLKGAADGFNPGGIYMSDENGVDVVVENYSGNTVLFYTHNAEDPNEIIGGTFTIKSAEAGSAIKLQTDNSGIDMDNPDEVQGALDNMAHKLFYNGVTENPDNLSGVVEIAEGLLTTSASLKVGMIEYDAENNGQGMLASGSVETPEELKNPEIIYGDKETAMMRGAKSAMASTTMMWRAENNDIMKRMGDLRLNNGEKGLWAKYYGGKYEMDAQKANMSTSYKAYQLGYDAQVGDGWILGAAVSYNDGESTYTMGHGDESVVSLGIYGTWTGKDGQYFDVIAKRSKLSNEYTINNTYGHKLEADYDAWGTSLSAEYGKRFEAKSGFYVDPSVELTIGRVNGGSYDAQSDYLDAYGKNKALHVEQDDFDSVIGRIGLRLGQKLNNASYFAKLALAHEFNGDFTTTFKAEGEPDGRTAIDFGDTWYELQLGGTAKLSDNSLLYASFERSFGGDVQEKWRVDAGLRFSF